MEKETKKQFVEDSSLDITLRPKKWDDYIGQNNVKRNLNILIKAAKQREEPIEHVLFYGSAGLGKTTLAHIISRETSSQIKITSGPSIEKVGDLASVLTNLEKNDILFIDEIHRLNKTIEEILYPAMESRSLNIIIGKGPSARTIQLELPPFTLVAATTKIASLSTPLRSRFSGGIFKLENYSQEEIEEIIKRSAKILNVDIENPATKKIAKRSRFTPRTSNRLLKRCRDLSQINEEKVLTESTVKKAFEMMNIDNKGLDNNDKEILLTIINKFQGGPVGLKTLSAATSEDSSTIEDVYEPYLIQLGFIKRTKSGRVATINAYNHLEIDCPEQNKLI